MSVRVCSKGDERYGRARRCERDDAIDLDRRSTGFLLSQIRVENRVENRVTHPNARAIAVSTARHHASSAFPPSP